MRARSDTQKNIPCSPRANLGGSGLLNNGGKSIYEIMSQAGVCNVPKCAKVPKWHLAGQLARTLSSTTPVAGRTCPARLPTPCQYEAVPPSALGVAGMQARTSLQIEFFHTLWLVCSVCALIETCMFSHISHMRTAAVYLNPPPCQIPPSSGIRRPGPTHRKCRPTPTLVESGEQRPVSQQWGVLRCRAGPQHHPSPRPPPQALKRSRPY